MVQKSYANLYGIKVCNCLVRAKLEYESIIWNPVCSILSNRVKIVPRYFIYFALQPLHVANLLPPHSDIYEYRLLSDLLIA